MPIVSKDRPESAGAISSVLAQILLDEPEIDESKIKPEDKAKALKAAALESETTVRSFLILIPIDVKAALSAVFTIIELKDEPISAQRRNRLINFLKENIFAKAKDLLHSKPDVELYAAEQIKALLPTASDEHFKLLMEMLHTLKIFSGDEGATKLVELIVDQSGVKLDGFKPSDVETLKKVLNTMHLALPLYKKKSGSNSAFFNFLVLKVLPSFDQFDDKLRLSVLHTVAESAPFITTSDARATLASMYKLLCVCICTSCNLQIRNTCH